MSKYAEMSDFEINKLVDERWKECPSMFRFDYCNDPAGAWPIIDEIWDELLEEYGGWKGVTVWRHVIDQQSCSKLRAAMIVYLMMEDEE